MDYRGFEQFEQRIRAEWGDDEFDLTLVETFDHEAHIERLNRYAEQVLGLSSGERVSLKIIWYKKVQIHTLIFRVFTKGRMYTAGLERRLSLGLIDRVGERWQSLLAEAYEIAMSKPAVGLDPRLEDLRYYQSSSGNGDTKSRMTFRNGNSRIVITAKKGVVECSGDEQDLIAMLQQLKNAGLQ